MRWGKVIARFQRAGVALGAKRRLSDAGSQERLRLTAALPAADLRSGLREPARGMVPHVLFE